MNFVVIVAAVVAAASTFILIVIAFYAQRAYFEVITITWTNHNENDYEFKNFHTTKYKELVVRFLSDSKKVELNDYEQWTTGSLCRRRFLCFFFS